MHALLKPQASPTFTYCVFCGTDHRQDFSTISGDTSSTISTETAKRWLETCLSSHELCNPKPAALPKRLIDITPCRRRELPRVLETDAMAQDSDIRSSYVCLSHCWGKQPIIRTTKSSLNRHRDGIPWQELPKTFQDAINISLDFNIDYIWIDSLCIVQDDEIDWHEQAGQMASVYQNCLFTIVAIASSDGSGGCYRTPGQDYSQNLEFTRSSKSGEVCSVFARKRIQHPDNEVHSGLGLNIGAPLIDRAWAFQEHFLAPRLLQYTATEIMWECNEMLTCECGQVDPEQYQRKKPAYRATTSAENATILQTWRLIIRAFTMRYLTYHSDRLPALSGLAKRIQQSLFFDGSGNEGYYAGLWGCDMLTGLAWSALGDPIDWSRATPYRAPTWSWASVEGRMGWDFEINGEREPYARISQVSCDPAGADRTGAVTGGKLELSGLTIPVAVTDYDYLAPTLRHCIAYTGPSTDGLVSSRGEIFGLIESDYQWADPGDLYIAPGETLTCLRLGWRHTSPDDPEEFEGMFSALLLRPSGLATKVFQRVGIVTARWADDPLRIWFQDAKKVQITII
ncbi:MAG: hypothetical protein Q9218_002132 [Villophora microphyllina]